MSKAKGIHLGHDGEGIFFSFVEEDTGTFHRVHLSDAQVILLADQASAEGFKIARRAIRQLP